MALIRGTNSICPCPVCLVDKKNLMELPNQYPLRTKETMKAAVDEAERAPRAAIREKILKELGLRGVVVRCCACVQSAF